MTEERYRTGPGDERDAEVSARYRELAQERTPKHLDKAVLSAAAEAARPRYSRLRSWTRPLAWAATVVLSVALVLEVSKLPTPDSQVFEVPAGDTALESGAADAADDLPDTLAETEAPEVVAPAAVTPARSHEEAPAELGAASAGRTAAPQPSPGRDREKRQRSIAEPMKQEHPVTTEAPQSTPQLEPLRPKETDMLQRAEEQARHRVGESKRSDGQLELTDTVSVQAFGVAADRADAASCDEVSRATPETWLECIAELEALGQTDVAQFERERLLETFPDFELP